MLRDAAPLYFSEKQTSIFADAEIDILQAADRLLKLEVDIGVERRYVLAGIAEFYEPEALVGRKVILVANLAPRKIRGIESQGMLLAADADGRVSLLQPDSDLPAGAKVR